MKPPERAGVIQRFLETLWPDGLPAGAELTVFDPNTKGHLRFRDLAQAAAVLALGAFAYFACALMLVGTSGRRAEHAIAIPGFWLDLDTSDGKHAESNLPTFEEALDFLASLPIQPTIVLRSGGGLYVWWLFRELWVFDTAEERGRAQAMGGQWQGFVLERAAAYGWKLDNTSSLSQVLRAEGSLNAKYDPPRPVERIQGDGPRWNPSDFELWTPEKESTTARTGGSVELPKELPESIALAVAGLGDLTRPVTVEGALKALVLEVCPACAGVQHRTSGTAKWSAHISPLKGALRCKRQSCEAREPVGLAFTEWTRRFLQRELAERVNERRSAELAALQPAVTLIPAEQAGESVPLAVADGGKLDALINEACDHSLEHREIALTIVTLGAGKTRAVVRRLAKQPAVYSARTHDLLSEVGAELDRQGTPYFHMKGVGQACRFQDGYEHYGRRSDWRRVACTSCPYKEDETCEAWHQIPDGRAILAPHEALTTLSTARLSVPGQRKQRPLFQGALVVIDESTAPVQTLVMSRERALVPYEWPGPFGSESNAAVHAAKLADDLLGCALRARRHDHEGEHPTRYEGVKLKALWDEATSLHADAEILPLLRRAAAIEFTTILSPQSRGLREKTLDPKRIPHPDLPRVWGALLGVVEPDAAARDRTREQHGDLEVVADDKDAWFEVRARHPLPIPKDHGVVLLDATGNLTREQLEAANPAVPVRVFAMRVAPDPRARILLVHIPTTNVTRRRLFDERKVTPRALGTLRNALGVVSALARDHVGPGPTACSLITHAPLARALTKSPAKRASVVPRGLRLAPEHIGYFGRDERGSNAFRDTRIHITFGDPVENIGSTEADARLLGVDSKALVQSRASAALLQAQGRSRALRAEGPKLLAHVGSCRPSDWTEYRVVKLPPGRPEDEVKATVEWLVEAFLAAGDIVSSAIVEATIAGSLEVPPPLAKTANYGGGVGSFGQSPPSRRSQRRWTKDAAKAAGAVELRVVLPDRRWIVWKPELMSDAEAEERARWRWRELSVVAWTVADPPPEDERLSAGGTALGSVLIASGSNGDPTRWVKMLRKRTAALRRDAGLPRARAEAQALAEVIADLKAELAREEGVRAPAFSAGTRDPLCARNEPCREVSPADSPALPCQRCGARDRRDVGDGWLCTRCGRRPEAVASDSNGDRPLASPSGGDRDG